MAGSLVSCLAVPAGSDYRVILGKEIRVRRKRAGLTQEKLAERAQMHPNYLGRVERGEETASVEALRKIADGVGVPISDLFRGI